MKDEIKLYVTRKYVWAHTAGEAIRKEKEQPVSEVYIDEDWKAQALNRDDNQEQV